MNPRSHRPIVPLLILSVCLIFLGGNGFIGGYYMLSEPNGAPMDIPISLLDATVFRSWVVPGLFLVFLWGFGSLIVLIGLWLRPHLSVFDRFTHLTRHHWGWGASVLLGLALLFWLAVQFFTFFDVAPIQYILGGLALILVMMPLLPGMRRYYAQRDGR